MGRIGRLSRRRRRLLAAIEGVGRLLTGKDRRALGAAGNRTDEERGTEHGLRVEQVTG